METGTFIKKVKDIFGVECLSLKQLDELVNLQLEVEEDMIVRPNDIKRDYKYGK